jgi:hypothetical protein
MGLSREGSNPHVEECQAAINYDTPFWGYLCWCRALSDTGGGGSKAELKFFLPRHAYMRDITWIGRVQMLVVEPSFAQREVAVDGSADYVGVAVVLAIVLPPADLA